MSTESSSVYHHLGIVRDAYRQNQVDVAAPRVTIREALYCYLNGPFPGAVLTTVDGSGYTTWGPPGAGPQGAQGASGAQGATGAQGVSGNQGAQGSTGLTGAQGAQGVSGAVGAQGAQGVSGAVGAQGAQGVSGAVGAQGAQGVAGAVGAQGAQGVAGAVGAQGAQGVAGAVGAQGAQGVSGSQGAQGASGATGSQGAQGASGATGSQGAQGAQGPSTVNVGKTIFVDATFGSDGTGARQNQILPFLTLGAARAVAVSGDTIYVRPGTYNVSTALAMIDGVSWFFEQGAIVIGTSSNYIFSAVSGTPTCSLSGFGQFQPNGGLLNQTVAANIVFSQQLVIVNDTSIATLTVINLTAGNLTVILGGGASATASPQGAAYYINILSSSVSFTINQTNTSTLLFNSNGVYISCLFIGIANSTRLYTNTFTCTSTDTGFFTFIIATNGMPTLLDFRATDIVISTRLIRTTAVTTTINFNTLTLNNASMIGFVDNAIFKFGDACTTYVNGNLINVTQAQSPTNSAEAIFNLGTINATVQLGCFINVKQIISTIPILNGSSTAPGCAARTQIDCQTIVITNTGATALAGALFYFWSKNGGGAANPLCSLRANRLDVSLTASTTYLFATNSTVANQITVDVNIDEIVTNGPVLNYTSVTSPSLFSLNYKLMTCGNTSLSLTSLINLSSCGTFRLIGGFTQIQSNETNNTAECFIRTQNSVAGCFVRVTDATTTVPFLVYQVQSPLKVMCDKITLTNQVLNTGINSVIYIAASTTATAFMLGGYFFTDGARCIEFNTGAGNTIRLLSCMIHGATTSIYSTANQTLVVSPSSANTAPGGGGTFTTSPAATLFVDAAV